METPGHSCRSRSEMQCPSAPSYDGRHGSATLRPASREPRRARSRLLRARGGQPGPIGGGGHLDEPVTRRRGALADLDRAGPRALRPRRARCLPEGLRARVGDRGSGPRSPLRARQPRRGPIPPRSLRERSVAIRRRKLGDGHQFIAESLLCLGQVRRTPGEPEGAADRFRQAVDISESTVGLSYEHASRRLRTSRRFCARRATRPRATAPEARVLSTPLHEPRFSLHSSRRLVCVSGEEIIR